MPNNSGNLPPLERDSRPERSPRMVFARIRKVFQELGILGSNLSLEYEGIWYRVSCDNTAFMVYRVNTNSRVRHQVTGWPVCLVNSDTIFEECSSPGIGRDHYACGVDLEKWLEIVDRHCRSNLTGIPQH
jgi:hypothetical protein